MQIGYRFENCGDIRDDTKDGRKITNDDRVLLDQSTNRNPNGNK